MRLVGNEAWFLRDIFVCIGWKTEGGAFYSPRLTHNFLVVAGIEMAFYDATSMCTRRTDDVRRCRLLRFLQREIKLMLRNLRALLLVR